MIQYIEQLLWEIDLPMHVERDSFHLDLGSGSHPRNPFSATRLIACDVLPAEQVEMSCEYLQCDITVQLPFGSDTFSSISAFDVLEHIPRWERRDGEVQFPFVNLMSEIFRVLKPGGYFYAVTPMYPSSSAFTDPTHVNVMTLQTVSYFGGANHAKQLGYGFEGGFEIIFANWLRGAGPFALSGSLFGQVKNNPWSRKSLRAELQLLNRWLRRLFNRKPTHVLWVLRKPV